MTKRIAAILLTLLASPGMAQEHQHGTGEKLGAVHFATSCNDVAQKDFNRALALLHSFDFGRAIQGFNAVLEEDATCAIAYFGVERLTKANQNRSPHVGFILRRIAERLQHTVR